MPRKVELCKDFTRGSGTGLRGAGRTTEPECKCDPEGGEREGIWASVSQIAVQCKI